MPNIVNDSAKQISVLLVSGSSNKCQLKYVNTMAPIENPINLDGHICPL
jgi:hypothetical protein